MNFFYREPISISFPIGMGKKKVIIFFVNIILKINYIPHSNKYEVMNIYF